MTKIEFNLADDFARDARAAGVLEQEKLEALVREEMRRQAGERLKAMMDKLHTLPGGPMPMDEISTLVNEVRREGRERENRR
jgi:hypothetical protein